MTPLAATAISGSAIRCALGSTPQTVASALLAGESGAVTLSLRDFGGRDYPYFPIDEHAVNEEVDAAARLLQLLSDCVADALQAAGLDEAALQRSGLFLGSSSFVMGSSEQRYRRALAAGKAHVLFDGEHYGDTARALRERFSLGGGDYSFSTACTSSANALLYASQAVASGQLDHAVVVGMELFNRTTLFGFDSMQLLDRNGYRPFDAQRNGMVLGEGVGAVVLSGVSDTTHQHHPLLLGGATTSDPQGITGSSAASMARAMQQALVTTQCEAGTVALIRSHGTGSLSNDQSEAEAMRQIFGTRLPPLVALKGALGHTLGGCGVVELVALLACLQQGLVPAAVGFATRDEALGCAPLTTPLPFHGGTVLLNHFGFGGNNTSLLLQLEGR